MMMMINENVMHPNVHFLQTISSSSMLISNICGLQFVCLQNSRQKSRRRQSLINEVRDNFMFTA